MIRRRELIAAAVLAGTGALAGCASGTAVSVASATSSPTVAPSSQSVTDKESCEAFGDVSTILFNATVDMHDGRMSQQEYDGWMRLATRVLDRVPIRGEGAVSDAITTLKQLAPPIAAGSNGATTIGSPQWSAAAPLVDACQAAGSDLIVQGFTGG